MLTGGQGVSKEPRLSGLDSRKAIDSKDRDVVDNRKRASVGLKDRNQTVLRRVPTWPLDRTQLSHSLLASAPPTAATTRRAGPRSRGATQPLRGRPHDVDDQMGGRVSRSISTKPMATASATSMDIPTSTSRLETPARWPATHPRQPLLPSSSGWRLAVVSPPCCPPRTLSGSARSWLVASSCHCGRSRLPLLTQTAGRFVSPGWPRGGRRCLAFSYCYHGSVDETVVVRAPDGATMARPGNVGPQVDPSQTTRVAEFNDLESVESALAHGDVAVVITEPALTNIGIVLPEPGFLDGLRALCTKYGALLLIDETHTFSAGPGGMTLANNLSPDIVVIGKSIAGGIPIGTYGISQALPIRSTLTRMQTLVDVGGVGGTLAGNALSMAAARATLGEVLTDDAFLRMIALATSFTDGVQKSLDRADVPWSISQLGARAEYRFARPAPRNGHESAAAGDDDLDEYLHLYTLNRGIMMTPFHNMALMCPSTSKAMWTGIPRSLPKPSMSSSRTMTHGHVLDGRCRPRDHPRAAIRRPNVVRRSRYRGWASRLLPFDKDCSD